MLQLYRQGLQDICYVCWCPSSTDVPVGTGRSTGTDSSVWENQQAGIGWQGFVGEKHPEISPASERDRGLRRAKGPQTS